MMNQLKQQQLDREYLDVVNAENIRVLKDIISDNIYDGNDLSFDSHIKVMQLIKDKYKNLYTKLYNSWDKYSYSMFPFDFDTYEFDKLLTKLANKVANDYDPKYL